MFERRVAGKVPRKHHIQFKDEKGALLYEECFTRDGFEGPYTIAYHQKPPHTQSLAAVAHGWKAPEAITGRPLAKRHYKSQEMKRVGGAPIDARVPLLFNADVTLGVLHPTEPDPVYFSNADGDELFYIHEGGGLLRSTLGDLRFEAQDYVFIPRGMVHRILPDAGVPQYWLSMELKGGLHLPRQWRNEVGQLRMDAPYCHRDFRCVEFTGPRDEGIREMVVKRGEAFHGFAYQHTPLDVVGWDGTVYPWVFPILHFQPRAGLVHLPPTWHGTFAARGALICSFVPRVVDFHPEAIPCPYPHTSVDCDEFLFYCKGNFISRRGVGPGSISHHPIGMTHGPHPGAYEASIGHRTTDELAVMLDTTLPLLPTAAALTIEDPNYQNSFIP
ncbi:homogentisate 1,2-dioxygenase [Stigmatella aurantiaca]|uniref:Homogentisate 1,2-dioxygenase n=1 Tax=Stigmatella aurantiaca (strain DW4/3-1) TaxID=378806 RepID=Q08WC0_STIAD|nr:homogentisate 1,2-dioxygenase [Stigmatella aurantiaca]ADO69267.1 Homogentisate 1,2-dioxygenase [Stigmatella aurantiaca DW4/3-1]EAU64794.1 homogentisate 1,2-dioxygenase [Stigmatella aurantiaca DW4/3-1]